jgi:hypothetical protein
MIANAINFVFHSDLGPLSVPLTVDKSHTINPSSILSSPRSGAAFFSLTLFPAFFAPITAKIGTTPLMLAVLIGAAQNILSKGIPQHNAVQCNAFSIVHQSHTVDLLSHIPLCITKRDSVLQCRNVYNSFLCFSSDHQSYRFVTLRLIVSCLFSKSS